MSAHDAVELAHDGGQNVEIVLQRNHYGDEDVASQACLRSIMTHPSWRGLCWSMIFSENRSQPWIKSGAGFFRIMLWRDVVVRRGQRLVQIVDVVDLAAQNGNDIRR